MVSSAKQIESFNPDPRAVKRPTKADFHGLSDSEVAAALANGHPKSKPPMTHPRMEGPRTGLPHISPVSSRFIKAHGAVGTKVTVPSEGP